MAPKLASMLAPKGLDTWSQMFFHGPSPVTAACTMQPRNAIMARRPFLTSFFCMEAMPSLPRLSGLNHLPPGYAGLPVNKT